MSAAESAIVGLGTRSISPLRLSTARAFARRTAVHKCCNSEAKAELESECDLAASALAIALRVHMADGPHPPVDSPTKGRNSKPCEAQSAAVLR